PVRRGRLGWRRRGWSGGGGRGRRGHEFLVVGNGGEQLGFDLAAREHGRRGGRRGLRRGGGGDRGRRGDRSVEALAALGNVVVSGEATGERVNLVARLVEQLLLDVEVDFAQLLRGRRRGRGRFRRHFEDRLLFDEK